jgi:hypothetical protein
MKVVAIRYFIAKRKGLIDMESKEALLDKVAKSVVAEDKRQQAVNVDLERLFSLMSNKRFVYVIRRLVLQEAEPKVVAQELGTNVDNLYNIKKRALRALTEIALKEIEGYEKKIG